MGRFSADSAPILNFDFGSTLPSILADSAIIVSFPEATRESLSPSIPLSIFATFEMRHTCKPN